MFYQSGSSSSSGCKCKCTSNWYWPAIQANLVHWRDYLWRKITSMLLSSIYDKTGGPVSRWASDWIIFSWKVNEREKIFADHNKELICYKFKEVERTITRLIINDNDFIKLPFWKRLRTTRGRNVFAERGLVLMVVCKEKWNVYWRPF